MVRLEPLGGAPLSPPRASEALLRPALEVALAVAKAGEEETPSVPAPVALRPFLRFAKLPPRAQAVTRRVLEADEDFRARVAEVADEDAVGRAGWLFLNQPEGWEGELAALEAGADEAAEQETDRRAEAEARRRLAGAEEAARRAEQLAGSARAEAAQATAALAEERRARLLAAEGAAAAAQRAEQLAAERDRARAAAAGAASETAALRGRLADLQAEVARLRSDLQQTVTSAAADRERAEAAEAVGSAGAQEAAPEPGPDVGRALRQAAAAARELADALAAAAAPLVGETAETGAGSVPDGADPEPVTPATPMRPPRRRPPASTRRPAPLPPATFDDSVEAAEHLTRLRGVVLVVDGYNVSQTGWPELPISEQRRRLVSALNELAARTGADVRLVFDGADMAMPGVVPTTGHAVRVSFSAPGVEADDEVLSLVEDLPEHRPVVVATSDRRVQRGAARVGANVISSTQLLAVLRR